jgi:hypothetical protein
MGDRSQTIYYDSEEILIALHPMLYSRSLSVERSNPKITVNSVVVHCCGGWWCDNSRTLFWTATVGTARAGRRNEGP